MGFLIQGLEWFYDSVPESKFYFEITHPVLHYLWNIFGATTIHGRDLFHSSTVVVITNISALNYDCLQSTSNLCSSAALAKWIEWHYMTRKKRSPIIISSKKLGPNSEWKKSHSWYSKNKSHGLSISLRIWPWPSFTHMLSHKDRFMAPTPLVKAPPLYRFLETGGYGDNFARSSHFCSAY